MRMIIICHQPRFPPSRVFFAFVGSTRRLLSKKFVINCRGNNTLG
jgi:hypothetical protein